MDKRDILTKSLAVFGTILAWLPIAAPVLFSAILMIQRGVFRFDYLMPAEFFPVALVGGGLLLWAASRARSRRGLIGSGLGAATAVLVSGQVLAVVTGLASGETQPTGLWWALVVVSLIVYSLALVAIGIGGLLLLRDLFRAAPAQPA